MPSSRANRVRSSLSLPVSQRTTEQANIVSEAAVASANDLSQKTVEGVENVALSTGLVNPVRGEEGGGRYSLMLFHTDYDVSLLCQRTVI